MGVSSSIYTQGDGAGIYNCGSKLSAKVIHCIDWMLVKSILPVVAITCEASGLYFVYSSSRNFNEELYHVLFHNSWF